MGHIVRHSSIFVFLAFSLGLTLLLPVMFVALRAVFRPVISQRLAAIPTDARALAWRKTRHILNVTAITYLLMSWIIPFVVWATT